MGATLRRLVPQTKITIPELPAEFVARPGCGGPRCRSGRRRGARLRSSRLREDAAPCRLVAHQHRRRHRVGAVWTVMTTTRCGCGRPSWPRSPPARRCRATSRLHDRWAWQPDAQPEFIAELTDALQALPQPIRLILDDMHELVDPQVLHGVQTFIRDSSPPPSSSCSPAGSIRRCPCPGCVLPAGCVSCAPSRCPSHRSRRRCC